MLRDSCAIFPASGHVGSAIMPLLDASCGGGLFGAADPNMSAGTCDNPAYAGSFVLTPGSHTLTVASWDNVGNEESAQTLQYFVVAPGPASATGSRRRIPRNTSSRHRIPRADASVSPGNTAGRPDHP